MNDSSYFYFGVNLKENDFSQEFSNYDILNFGVILSVYCGLSMIDESKVISNASKWKDSY